MRLFVDGYPELGCGSMNNWRSEAEDETTRYYYVSMKCPSLARQAAVTSTRVFCLALPA